MSFLPTYQLYGTHAILISWPCIIDSNIRKDIQIFESKINSRFPTLILETIVAYSSLSLFLQKDAVASNIIVQLEALYKEESDLLEKKYHIWEIPVCYDTPFGMDIEALAAAKGYSVSEVIEMHSAPLYEVYFLGFLPGFPYLGGLHTKLATPRVVIHRASVPKGAVAIGGSQTGVYPSESPGGWHIIGNTPVSFFDVNQSPPCFIAAGDKLKFLPITVNEYNQITILEKKNNYKIKNEVGND